MAEPWRVSAAGLDLAEAAREPLSILRVKGEPPRERLEALGGPLGLSWPLTPNTLAGGSPAVLWLAPCEWLVAGRGPTEREAALALADVVHHLTDATDALAAFDLRGPHARALAAGGCSLDLDPCAFGPGRCAQSQLDGASVLIRTLERATDLRLYVDVSQAWWLKAWLKGAAADFRP